MTEIRPPAVAGSFYPGDARTLVATVKALLAAAGVLNLVWSRVLLRGARKLRSPALAADGKHLMSDVVTSAGVLLGSGKLATELDRLDLIDEYQLLVHPRIAGHGPTLYEGGLPATRQLDLVSAKPLRCGAVAMHYRRAR